MPELASLTCHRKEGVGESTRWIATASGEVIRIWDARTLAFQRSLFGHEMEISDIAFSPDSMSLVSGGYDQTCRVWNWRRGTHRIFEGPFPFERRAFSWGLTGTVIRHRPTRLATLGYLGHMWELYAMWTWIRPPRSQGARTESRPDRAPGSDTGLPSPA